MEIKITEMSENFVKLVIKGEDHTYLNLLQHELLKDEDVVLAKYNIPHPYVGEPELVVRTKGKNPIQAIKEANERIVKKIEEVLSQI